MPACRLRTQAEKKVTRYPRHLLTGDFIEVGEGLRGMLGLWRSEAPISPHLIVRIGGIPFILVGDFRRR